MTLPEQDTTACDLVRCPRCNDPVSGGADAHLSSSCLQGHDAEAHWCCPSACELGPPVNTTRAIPADLPLEDWLAEIKEDEPMKADEKRGRALVRQRSGGMCECCGGKATNWHHRKNRSQGGDWSASNGMDVCGSGTTGCHGWITANPTAAEVSGWVVLAWQDPRTESLLLYGRKPVYLDDDGNYVPVDEETT